MIRVIVIEPNGHAREEFVEPVLAEFQRLIGGDIEGVRLKDETTYGYVCETGHIDRMPLNMRASLLVDAPLGPIVGPLIVLGGYDDDGIDLPIPDAAAAQLLHVHIWGEPEHEMVGRLHVYKRYCKTKGCPAFRVIHDDDGTVGGAADDDTAGTPEHNRRV